MKKPARPALVRVIRDSRNADLDYMLPGTRAAMAYRAGELHIDLINDCYTEHAATPAALRHEAVRK